MAELTIPAETAAESVTDPMKRVVTVATRITKNSWRR